jgi:hypothetical protein
MLIPLGKISINKSDFPDLLQKFLDTKDWGPTTRMLEGQAEHLSATNFASSHLSKFIGDVCRWGSYPGIAGRILRQNAIYDIRDKFITAWEILNSDSPNVGDALKIINQIKHLGTPSFASKHLRFLAPQICPVLDKIIWEGIGKYSFNPQGYKQFSEKCLDVANLLEKNGLRNPMEREGGKWFAADVEMAIFKYLELKNNSCKTHC